MSKINTSRIGGKTGVRFLRSWRGYRAGAVIVPPAALRQALLVQTVLGKPIVEVVENEIPAAISERPDDGNPGIQVELQALLPIKGDDDEPETKRGRGRPRKGESE